MRAASKRSWVLAASFALLAACGTADPGSDDPTGVIRAGAMTGGLPYVNLEDDGKTMVGFEPELLQEAAKRLEMSVDFTVTEFDGLLLGIDSGRFDIVMAGMTDDAEREKKYDALNHVNDLSTFVGSKELAASIGSLDDLCGRTVGVLSGSVFVALVEDQAKKCEADGDPLKMLTFAGESQGHLAVKSGQIDLYPSNLPLLSELVKSEPTLGLAEFQLMEYPVAYFLKKGSALAPRLRGAIQDMIEDGTYAEILGKWGVRQMAIPEVAINRVTAEGS